MDSKDKADEESLILENRKLVVRNKILWKKISLISRSEKRRHEEYFQTQVQILKLEIEIEKEKMRRQEIENEIINLKESMMMKVRKYRKKIDKLHEEGDQLKKLEARMQVEMEREREQLQMESNWWKMWAFDVMQIDEGDKILIERNMKNQVAKIRQEEDKLRQRENKEGRQLMVLLSSGGQTVLENGRNIDFGTVDSRKEEDDDDECN